jgi:hypothetical protein
MVTMTLSAIVVVCCFVLPMVTLTLSVMLVVVANGHVDSVGSYYVSVDQHPDQLSQHSLVPVCLYQWLRKHCWFFLTYVAMDQRPDLLAPFQFNVASLCCSRGTLLSPIFNHVFAPVSTGLSCLLALSVVEVSSCRL